MGRKPIGERAMTAAERQKRRRDKVNTAIEAAKAPPGSVAAFRLDVWRFLQLQCCMYPELTTIDVNRALEQAGRAFLLQLYLEEKGDWEAANDAVHYFLDCEDIKLMMAEVRELVAHDEADAN